MKKSLIALAALAAVSAASAQSNVTLFGTFDPSIQNISTTYGGGATSKQNTLGNNGQGTSQVSVKMTEDLGGGLSAIALYEGDFNVGSAAGTTAATGASGFHAIGSAGGEIFAGLQGGFGALKLGAPNTTSLFVQGNRQPIGTKIGSGFGGAMGTSHVRENSSVMYESPVMGGFDIKAGYAFKAGQTASSTIGAQSVAGTPLAAPQGAKSDIGLFYTAGPLRAGVSAFNQAATPAVATTPAIAAAGKNTQTNAFVQYDIAGATLYAGMHNETLASGAKSAGRNVAFKYALTGNVNLLGNYATLNDKSLANADKKIAALGAQYVFSKRTVGYARYVRETNDNVTATDKIKGVKTTLVGIQHNF